MTLSLLDLLVIALATWRLAFLLAREDAPFALLKRLRAKTTLGGLLNCLMCASIWCAALCYVLWQTPLQPIVVIAALSGAALMLASYTGANRPT